MTTIGTATLQIIPSLQGVSDSVNKQLGGALDGKKLGKAFGKDVAAGLKSTEADVKKAADAYGKFRDKAEDSLGKVRVAEAALAKARSANDPARIVAAEEKLATSRRNSTRAVNEAKTAYDLLGRTQRSLGSETEALGSKFGGLSGLAGTAGDAIKGAGVVAAGAAVVGIAALAAGVVAAGAALYELGAQFDDTFDNIRIKTGATGPALQQLEKATERLSTKVPLSIGEIGNVVAETSRALHLTGPDLDNVARSIANLGRLTGENVDVRTLGKAFRGFGVDAKDQVPALDSLLQASQSTGVGVNELLATVVKGGAGLRQFGFDFGESAALATQFEEAGLDSDKAMTGLTKGLAGLAKNGKTGQDALKGAVGEIKNLIALGGDANNAKALDLTNKLFGAKGGAQFFEAIRNGALDLDTLANSIGGTGDTIAQAAKDTDDWAERWQTFKNQIAVGLQPIATGVFDAVNDKLTQLADWVSGHQAEVIGFFTSLATGAISAFASINDFVAGSLRGLGQFVQQIIPTIEQIGDFGTAVGGVLSFIPGFESTGRALKAMGDGAGSLADGLKKVPTALNTAADGLNHLSDTARTQWIPNVKTVGQTMADAAKFTQALGDATGSLPDGKTIKLSDNSPEITKNLEALGVKVTTLPDGTISVTANTAEGQRIIDAFVARETGHVLDLHVGANTAQAKLDIDQFAQSIAGRPAINLPVATVPGQPGAPTPGNPFAGPYRASGGPISGPGGPKSDQVPIWASHGEHMWTASEVDDVGGQGNMYRLRAWARMGAFRHFATGGAMPTGLERDFGGGTSEWNYVGPGWADPNIMPPGGWGPGGKLAYQAYLRGEIPNPDYWKYRAGGGEIFKLADPRGFDPRGAEDGTGSLGPFAPWWDMDWMPPENPQRVGPSIPGVEGDWWHRGPTGTGGTGGGGKWAPPLGKDRKPLPGQLLPPWLMPHRIKMLGFKDGGAIGPDVRAAGELVGTPYDKGSRHDCSGMAARVIDRTLGLPETGLMSTKNAKEWLAARGFKPGLGGPGQISVGWYDHGPNPNDGHMAMTLSDGSNAESGGSVGDIFQIGGGAAGASNPEFDQHMFLPTVYGEGAAGAAAAASPFAGGGAAAAATGGGTPSAAPISSSSGGGGGSFSIPSSIGGLAGFGLGELGKGVGTTKSGSDLSLFGNAAASAVSGQVDSALGVLGVNGSPGWLKAISTLASGISIGGGGSADPLSAKPSGTGTPAPDDPGNMHGTRAGQAPGPTYNITARDTEDAFVKAQRVEREKAAAKLSRF